MTCDTTVCVPVWHDETGILSTLAAAAACWPPPPAAAAAAAAATAASIRILEPHPNRNATPRRGGGVETAACWRLLSSTRRTPIPNIATINPFTRIVDAPCKSTSHSHTMLLTSAAIPRCEAHNGITVTCRRLECVCVWWERVYSCEIGMCIPQLHPPLPNFASTALLNVEANVFLIHCHAASPLCGCQCHLGVGH